MSKFDEEFEEYWAKMQSFGVRVATDLEQEKGICCRYCKHSCNPNPRDTFYYECSLLNKEVSNRQVYLAGSKKRLLNVDVGKFWICHRYEKRANLNW